MKIKQLYLILNDINSYQNLLEVRADKFINDSYSKDGTWINGDWVQWKYHLNFTTNSRKDDKTQIISFSERKEPTHGMLDVPKRDSL